MSSRDKTIQAISNFYKTVVNHAYLDGSTLFVSPSDGWSDISIKGKNDVVLYFHHNQGTTEPTPLQPNCVFLAHSIDGEGTNVALDTDRGAMTPYCITGSDMAIPDEDYDSLPYEEKCMGLSFVSRQGVLRRLGLQVACLV
ncbi:hypothetical protein LQW54_007123 [Pestalotiopsis sp. IQ-011]